MQKIEAFEVAHIPVASIGPNPHNPRRLFDEEPLRVLRESIEKLGILVPVTVYQERGERRSTDTAYVLLDGERRWRCAQDLKLESVPAIVVGEPDDVQNILTMFHIHNLREGWRSRQLLPSWTLTANDLARNVSPGQAQRQADLEIRR